MAPVISYDEVPYADDPYPSSHPGHLAVVSILAGLDPVAVEHCRVLEIGCARGGNLIPMAAGLPEASFVGIDKSGRQVAAAREFIEACGLRNVAVECRNLVDVGDELGSFDYIIAHGVYSWVDAVARGRILEVMASRLRPGGLAYLSYNTHPGWRLRGIVRDLMAYRARRFDRPADCAREARRALEFVASSASAFDRAYAGWMGEECRYVRERADSYLLHDHLEAENEPVYFHELAERATGAGLRFVSEVQAGVLDVESFPPAAAAGLKGLAADDVEFEQYLDFLINRKFRQSVFCLAAREPGLPREEELARLHVAARPPVSLPRVGFRVEGRLRQVLHRVAAAWPSAIPWGELTGADQGRPPPRPRRADAVRGDPDLTSDLLRCYRLKILEFRAHRWPFVPDVSPRPLASAAARHQAGLGEVVTNLRHEAVRLDDLSRRVVRLLDGRRDRAEILRSILASRSENGPVPNRPIPPSSRDRPGPGRGRDHGEELDRCLETLARYAFLMS
ncbi:tRNA (guanine-N(7)-)-methyltransferase [Aquisphaera giovannonii]|uniref:tRNA (Guanine-N(7)-)-methyltransferase n=1 Tax=Aquisphaera giovannonii TaxID=406548 RepID=A0A5B9WB41_9BACT|nr:class I SAM-dependent methyltransferase [Aquisphaera giovannonii]QEH37255.1 tRNA (guanine-N(7)-)-methyltransferase [Aquisphaera giovannonii]